MTYEQLIEWAEQIPMDELYSKIRQLTGLSDLKFTSKVKDVRGHIVVQFASQDLADRVGFLKLIFKEIQITQFNSEVYLKAENEDEEPIPRYWGTASFSYTHPSGGSNGQTFLHYWYDDRTGWEFDERG